MLTKGNNINEASRFLASTLHEIRTPIQTIIGTIELISETSLDKEQTEYIRQIQFSAEVLLDLANNILDFTKIRSNEFKMEAIPFDIAHVTEQVVDLISIEAFNKGVEVVVDIAEDMPKFVTGDSVRVQQIMLNLVKNSVKFTNSGYIHIELSYKVDQVYFKITDSGIGISKEKQKKLFTDYFQADISTYRKFGGTGLGLSICKNLVNVMNGKIGVDSNPFGGSIFYFSIPLPISKDSELNIPIEMIKETHPTFPSEMRVLIVDESHLAIESMKNKLAQFGITDVESVSTAKDAIACLEFSNKIKNPFHSVFINLRLTSMDGWHLASEIKSNSLIKKDFKMYLLVPEGQMKSEAKMKLLDWFDGYLYKPIKRNKLAELISESTGIVDIKILPEINMTPLSEDSVKRDIEKPNFDIKVLVAEDHPVNRKLIESFLKGFGVQVFLAEDGNQAIEQIEKNPEISLIFMDIFMPKKSGVEATEELRKKGYNGIIIACTANNDSGDFADYMKIGINDILVKPFKKNTIKLFIEKWYSILQLPQTYDSAKIEILKPIPNSDTLDIWDFSEFLLTVDNDKTFAIKLIDDFISQTEQILKEIAFHLKESIDAKKIQALAHTLKGSSAAISARKLNIVAKELEEKAKKSTSIITAAKLDDTKIRKEFDRFKLYSKKILKDFKKSF